MKNIRSDLSADVRTKSAKFVAHMRNLLPSIRCDVGSYSTDPFLLRTFVSLRSENYRGDVAMTVNGTATMLIGVYVHGYF
jgi:hypothetical protein